MEAILFFISVHGPAFYFDWTVDSISGYQLRHTTSENRGPTTDFPDIYCKHGYPVRVYRPELDIYIPELRVDHIRYVIFQGSYVYFIIMR